MRAEMSLDTCLPAVAYCRWHVVVDLTSGAEAVAYRFSMVSLTVARTLSEHCALKRLEEEGTSACIVPT